jgi:hypothetical protein
VSGLQVQEPERCDIEIPACEIEITPSMPGAVAPSRRYGRSTRRHGEGIFSIGLITLLGGRSPTPTSVGIHYCQSERTGRCLLWLQTECGRLGADDLIMSTTSVATSNLCQQAPAHYGGIFHIGLVAAQSAPATIPLLTNTCH